MDCSGVNIYDGGAYATDSERPLPDRRLCRGSASVHTARTTGRAQALTTKAPVQTGSVDDTGRSRLKGAARSMSSSRSEFLKGLSARLQSDIALHEAEREEEALGTRLERSDEPRVEFIEESRGGPVEEPRAEPVEEPRAEPVEQPRAGPVEEPRVEPLEESLVEQEKRSREQIAADRLGTPVLRAAPLEPQDDAGPETVALVQPHQPRGGVAPVSSSPHVEDDLVQYPSASWAEAGMPLRLRDAIASVRRISHELYQDAPRGHGAMPAPPLADPADEEEFVSEREAPRRHGAMPAPPLVDPADEEEFVSEREAPRGHDAMPAPPLADPADEEEFVSEREAPRGHDAMPAPLLADPADEEEFVSEREAPRGHDAMPAPLLADPADEEEFVSEREPASAPPWDDAPADLDDRPAGGLSRRPADQIVSPTNEIAVDYAAAGDDSASVAHQLREFQTAFQREQIELEDGSASEEPPPTNELVLESDQRVLDDGAAHQEPRAPGDATHARMRSDDEEDEEPASGRGQELHDRLPARPKTSGGYGVHFTALAAAIVFVALAGFGFGMLSDSAGPGGSTGMRDTATAGPALPPGLSPPPAESQTPVTLEELATVRVASPPGNALAEPASVAPTTTPATTLPLPPPRKPELPQAATDQTPSDGQLAGAVDAAALAEQPVDQAGSAPSEATGVGGPFEPLFAKLPASQTAADQVLVHYAADSAGGPATAMHLVRELKAAGFSAEARAVQFSIRSNSVRYFFPGDRDQAEALRASLEGQLPGGAELSIMDFSSFEPKPQAGHLEVWLRS